MRELRDLYDEFGNKTELTYYKGDEIPKGYYPMVVMIAIENSDGKFLMQKRVPEKGGDYGVTGGHPKSGETPYEGIITEVKEEPGCDGKDCYKMYYVKADLDIADLNIQKEELTLVKYFSMQELEEMVENKTLNQDQVDFFIKCKEFIEKNKKI